jgi:uracil-DNA glycosylase
MGFCFPGQDAKGGDLPPRRECAPAWRARLMAAMPQIDLVLAIGLYAQAWHLGDLRGPR